MQLIQSVLERVDTFLSARWDLRRQAFRYHRYMVTPRQGRHTVRRRLLRRLLKGAPARCNGGHAEGR